MSMNTAHPGAPRTARGGYLNIVLTANAVLLGVLVFTQARAGGIGATGSVDLGSTALADPPEESDLNARVSAAEQRKDMISELRTMNQRLASLDARFKGAVPVKVIEMPRDGGGKPAPVPAPSK